MLNKILASYGWIGGITAAVVVVGLLIGWRMAKKKIERDMDF